MVDHYYGSDDSAEQVKQDLNTNVELYLKATHLCNEKLYSLHSRSAAIMAHFAKYKSNIYEFVVDRMPFNRISSEIEWHDFDIAQLFALHQSMPQSERFTHIVENEIQIGSITSEYIKSIHPLTDKKLVVLKNNLTFKAKNLEYLLNEMLAYYEKNEDFRVKFNEIDRRYNTPQILDEDELLEVDSFACDLFDRIIDCKPKPAFFSVKIHNILLAAQAQKLPEKLNNVIKIILSEEFLDDSQLQATTIDELADILYTSDPLLKKSFSILDCLINVHLSKLQADPHAIGFDKCLLNLEHIYEQLTTGNDVDEQELKKIFNLCMMAHTFTRFKSASTYLAKVVETLETMVDTTSEAKTLVAPTLIDLYAEARRMHLIGVLQNKWLRCENPGVEYCMVLIVNLMQITLKVLDDFEYPYLLQSFAKFTCFENKPKARIRYFTQMLWHGEALIMQCLDFNPHKGMVAANEEFTDPHPKFNLVKPKLS